MKVSMASGTGTDGSLTRNTANVLERPSPRRPGLGDSEGKAVGLGGFLGALEPVGEGGDGVLGGAPEWLGTHWDARVGFWR